MNFYFLSTIENLFYIPVLAYQSVWPTYEENSQQTIQVQKKEQERSPIKLNISKQDLIKMGYLRNNLSWTTQQDQKLKELMKTENMNWQQIAKKMQNRNAQMCYGRYRRLSYQQKKPWTSQQEKFIQDFVAQNGKDWKKIAEILKNYSARQIQQHYQFKLKPNLKKTDWTIEQDLQLINLLEKYGANWRRIQVEMECRSQGQIKNRYFGRLLKIVQKKEKNKQIKLKNI